MLFHARMDVEIPDDRDAEERKRLVEAEKERALELQRSGKWPHLWRIAGRYSNVSILDVESNDELHAMLSSLPLYPYLRIEVTPLATHPSDLAAQP